MTETREIQFKTRGDGDIIDITSKIEQAVRASAITSGVVTVFVPGSTGGVTTIEFEPGLLQDMPQLMEKLIPSGRPYKHDETWHDGNGFSHLRSSLIGPGITVPFSDSRLLLGTWQQVVFLEFDNRARSRRVILQVMGDAG
ncbi:MAG TPA: secondary thiamine-phosphate synthase enzyme YjbQ [Acidobacteriota bacterium]|nr:secondary thiamine-phosphate synthase enzyme YjbQ [Acidobacteriota bacterium]